MLIEAIAVNMLLSAGLLLLILHLDRYEREPLLRVLLLLAASVVATTLLGLAKQQLWGASGASPLVAAYLRAGLPEELLKFALFLGVAVWWRSYDESFDAIVYLSIIATGFAFNENIAYYMQATSGGALAAQETGDAGLYYRQLANIFAVRLVPSHLLVDISAGFFVGLGKVRGQPKRYFALGLLVAVALHGTWNYLGAAGMLAWFVFLEFVLSVFVCCAIFLGLRQSRYRAKQAELALLLEKNGYLLRHSASADADADGAGDAREALAAQLDRLRELLDNCHFMTGEEQDAIFALVERELPHPITEHLARDPAAVRRRLDTLEQRLAASRRARFDWRYSLGVFLILVATATVAYLLSVLAGDLLQRLRL